MLKEMKTQTHLKPGQKGTKQLVEKHGDALLCVRYRYDEKREVRLKTVELIVAEKAAKPAGHYRDDDTVAVIVAYTETALRDSLKTAGGRWCPEEKLWRVRYGAIMGDTDLISRILPD
ncbi:MAG: hypothetical protein PHH28_12675 [Desulfuromonadaceae bacterium]|nr:hypothetical protein [Desulfuromonadaceae bacterium]